MALTKIDDRGLKTPIDLLDNEKIRLGTGNDLEIYHNGTDSIIKDAGTGSLSLLGSAVFLQNAAQSETCLSAVADGAVSLYYDNSKKLETYTDGIKVTNRIVGDGGDLRLSSGAANGDIQFQINGTTVMTVQDTSKLEVNDDFEIVLGNGSDLILKHNATDSSIINSTGDFLIQCTGDDLNLKAADDVNIKVQGGAENAIIAYGDGAVELYYDNTKKLETTSDGVWVSGHIRAGDDAYLKLGASGDLQIYHNGTHSYIKNSTGNLLVRSDTITFESSAGDETYIDCNDDGSVELFHNNTKRVETNSTGVSFFGNLWATDNDKITLGHQNDLQIYHSSTNNIIQCENGHELHINKSDTENLAKFVPDGAVELYYDNTKCLETRPDGGIEATDGNVIIGTAGHGIQFDTGDSGSDQLLDDYEEGSWTPAYSPASGSFTMFANSGTYVKIGKLVICSGTLSCNGSSSPSGTVYISGLPFTVDAVGGSWNNQGGGGSVFPGYNFTNDMTNLVCVKSGTTAYVFDDSATALAASDVGTGYNEGQSSFTFTYTHA
jgi:hypothetical protein